MLRLVRLNIKALLLICLNIKIFCPHFSVSILYFYLLRLLSLNIKFCVYIDTEKSVHRIFCFNIEIFAQTSLFQY